MLPSFSARVAYAKKCILSDMGRSHYGFSRAFDNCFEMGDGAYVMVRLWQEAEKDTKLEERLRGFGTDSARDLYKKLRHLSAREIGNLARTNPIS